MLADSGPRCPNGWYAPPMADSGPVSTARIIDGRALGKEVRSSVSERITADTRPVRLDAIRRQRSIRGTLRPESGEDQGAVGIDYRLHRIPAGAGYDEIAGRVLLLNTNEDVTAIMLHMPLPADVDTERIQSLIDPAKDVEGVNPANIGNVVYGRRSLVPCTALAAVEMIESTGVELKGSKCVVIGASNIVGKPVAVLLMRAEATVISTNKFTPDLASYTRDADVLVTAAGVPGLVTRDMVKPGAVVIDVGINRIVDADGASHTVGDVAFDEVSEVAGWLTPVPGGVGPMTVAMLLRNTAEAALG